MSVVDITMTVFFIVGTISYIVDIWLRLQARTGDRRERVDTDSSKGGTVR